MRARVLETLMFAGIIPWMAGLYGCGGMPGMGGMKGCGASSTTSQSAPSNTVCPSGQYYNQSTNKCVKN